MLNKIASPKWFRKAQVPIKIWSTTLRGGLKPIKYSKSYKHTYNFYYICKSYNYNDRN